MPPTLSVPAKEEALAAYLAWKRNASIGRMIPGRKIATEWCSTGRRCDGSPASVSRTGRPDARDRAAGARGGGIITTTDTAIDIATGATTTNAATSAAVMIRETTIGLTTGDGAENGGVPCGAVEFCFSACSTVPYICIWE